MKRMRSLKLRENGVLRKATVESCDPETNCRHINGERHPFQTIVNERMKNQKATHYGDEEYEFHGISYDRDYREIVTILGHEANGWKTITNKKDVT